jgi:DNA-binding winged helix-turn-helix (wHTH) protein
MAAGGVAGSPGHCRDRARTRGEVIRVGRLHLDLGRLTADTGQGQVPLTRLEFLLLRELAAHPGQPVPKTKLLAALWGYESGPGSNVIDMCVRRLRSKFGFDLIKTVRGEGYQLAGQLSPHAVRGRRRARRQPARGRAGPPSGARPARTPTSDQMRGLRDGLEVEREARRGSSSGPPDLSDRG